MLAGIQATQFFALAINFEISMIASYPFIQNFCYKLGGRIFAK